MRSRASHPRPHQTWVPALCLSHRGSGAVTASACQRSKGVPHCRRQVPVRALAITTSTAAGWPAAFLLRKARNGGGGRNARATSSRSRTFWKSSPPAIRFRKSPAAAGLPQSSSKLKNSHVSLHPLSSTSPGAAIQKAPSLVKKLWTITLPCGTARKTKD
jgi:hypothetical protein